MHCFIVGQDRRGSDDGSLSDLVQRLAHPVTHAATLAELNTDPRFSDAVRPLVLVASDAEPASARATIAFAQEQRGHAFVVHVSDTIAPDFYKQLVRTGSAEWIQWASGEQELRELVARLAVPDTGERGAKITCFLPSKGGVGNTMLAVEVATLLAARRRRNAGRIAILDLNLQGGTLADALDLEPRFDVAEIVGRPERLDEQLIDVFTSRHSAALDVFASPARRMGPDEVDPQIIFTFLDLISGRYDAVLCDLPPYWLSWTGDLLRGSDAVVVTGGASVPALRRLGWALGELGAIGVVPDRLAVVLNGVEVDVLGRVGRRAEIERILAGQRLFFVRRDAAAVRDASDVGRPLLEMMPNTRVSRDIRRMAEWVAMVTGRAADADPAAQRPRGGGA